MIPADDRWTAIPPAVRAVIEDRLGPVVRVEPLGGMSGAGVVRVAGRGGTRVVKRTASDREAFVYRGLAPVLATAGVRIPCCDFGEPIAGGGAWLVLEDIPRLLPRDRWGRDQDVLATLARLHAIPPSVLDPIDGGFRPVWDEALDRAAGRWLPPVAVAHLDAHRSAFRELGEGRRVLSGDPNPLNWGMDRDGEVVLMDWDRIGTGHPAIDVAISVPGLAGPAELLAAADLYAVAGRQTGRGSDVAGIRAYLAVKVWTALGIFAEADPVADPDDDASPAGRLAGVARTLTGSLADWLGRWSGR